MRKKCRVLIFIGILLISHNAFSQQRHDSINVAHIDTITSVGESGQQLNYYDNAARILAYQKGIDLFDSKNRKIGRIGKTGAFMDTLGNLITTGSYRDFMFTLFYRNRPNVDYNLVHKEGQELLANGRAIGRIEGPRIYNNSGALIGYVDNNITEGEAIMFYFLLLPNWGNKVP